MTNETERAQWGANNPARPFLGSFFASHPELRMMAIHADGGSPRLYHAPSVDAAIEWGSGLNPQGWNIYFHVNCGTADRLSTQTVNGIRALHVDIDPPENVGPAEADAWRRIVCADLEQFWPTHIVASGRGLQGFWVTNETFPVKPGDELNSIRQIERLNARLAIRFVTDTSTRDAARIMKVPGFIAWPNQKKSAARWQPQRVQLVGGTGQTLPDEGLVWLGQNLPDFVGSESVADVNAPDFSEFFVAPTDPVLGIPVPTRTALRQAAENMSPDQEKLARTIWKKVHGGRNSRWVSNGVREDQKVTWEQRHTFPDKTDPSAIWGWMLRAAIEVTRDPVPAYAALMQTGFVQHSCTPEGYVSRADKCEYQLIKYWGRYALRYKEKRNKQLSIVRALLERNQNGYVQRKSRGGNLG